MCELLAPMTDHHSSRSALITHHAKGLQPPHTCHWPGCQKEIPPALWGCKQHWLTLPQDLRSRIWATYRRGQEITKTPSADYVAAAKAVQEWIARFQQGMVHHASQST